MGCSEINCCAPLVPKPGSYPKIRPVMGICPVWYPLCHAELEENLTSLKSAQSRCLQPLARTNQCPPIPMAACPSLPRQTKWTTWEGSWPSLHLLPCCHLSTPGKRDASLIPGPKARSGHWKMNYVSFISKKQSRSPFVIKFAVRETLLYLITSDISWLLVLETIKV